MIQAREQSLAFFINIDMPFTVETGAGLATSNSYASVAENDAYCVDRSITDTRTTVQKQATLIRATDFIDGAYIFKSVKLSDAQALENPRFGDTALSAKVKQATIALSLSLFAADTATAPVRGILSEEITAGEVTTKTSYDPALVASIPSDPYPQVTSILRTVATRASASVQSGMMSQ